MAKAEKMSMEGSAAANRLTALGSLLVAAATDPTDDIVDSIWLIREVTPVLTF